MGPGKGYTWDFGFHPDVALDLSIGVGSITIREVSH